MQCAAGTACGPSGVNWEFHVTLSGVGVVTAGGSSLAGESRDRGLARHGLWVGAVAALVGGWVL
jgi:hypothetical protein